MDREGVEKLIGKNAALKVRPSKPLEVEPIHLAWMGHEPTFLFIKKTVALFKDAVSQPLVQSGKTPGTFIEDVLCEQSSSGSCLKHPECAVLEKVTHLPQLFGQEAPKDRMNTRTRVVVSRPAYLFAFCLIIAMNGMIQAEFHKLRKRNLTPMADPIRDDLSERLVVIQVGGAHRPTPFMGSPQVEHRPLTRSYLSIINPNLSITGLPQPGQ